MIATRKPKRDENVFSRSNRHCVQFLVLVLTALSLLACRMEMGIQGRRGLCEEPLTLAANILENRTGTFVVATVPAHGEQELITRLNNCICAQISVGHSLEPGDNYGQEVIVDRTQLRLNGVVLEVASRSDPLDTHNVIWPDGATAYYEGPFAICWRAEQLISGEQHAEITFTRTSTKVDRYAWSFDLVPSSLP